MADDIYMQEQAQHIQVLFDHEHSFLTLHLVTMVTFLSLTPPTRPHTYIAIDGQCKKPKLCHSATEAYLPTTSKGPTAISNWQSHGTQKH